MHSSLCILRLPCVKNVDLDPFSNTHFSFPVKLEAPAYVPVNFRTSPPWSAGPGFPAEPSTIPGGCACGESHEALVGKRGLVPLSPSELKLSLWLQVGGQSRAFLSVCRSWVNAKKQNKHTQRHNDRNTFRILSLRPSFHRGE